MLKRPNRVVCLILRDFLYPFAMLGGIRTVSTAIPATETPFEVVVSGENQKAVLEVVVFFRWFVNLGINLCHDKP